jgi:cellobiose-specific phosphotransferase system component IIC
VFVNGLLDEIPKRSNAVSPVEVLAVGPTAFQHLARTPEILRALQNAYATAIQLTMYSSLATVCIALPFALGMQWLNVKNVAEAQNAARTAEDSP